ncbi:MAG: hypothetical protein ACO1QR_08150 [Chthoniobacteraceae bacterium]
MTTGGWIIMIVSVSAVTTAFGWSIWRVLTISHPEEHLHAPPSIEHDEEP